MADAQIVLDKCNPFFADREKLLSSPAPDGVITLVKLSDYTLLTVGETRVENSVRISLDIFVLLLFFCLFLLSSPFSAFYYFLITITFVRLLLLITETYLCISVCASHTHVHTHPYLKTVAVCDRGI